MKRVLTVILCALTAIACCSCGAANNNPSDGKLSVACLDFPSYDFARAVCGGSANVELLIPSDADVHSWVLTLSETAAIQKCDLLVFGGGEGGENIDKAVSSSATPPKVFKLIDCVKLLEEETAVGMEPEEEHGDEKEFDVHVWTSPVNAVQICKSLRDTLCGLDKANADAYKANCDAYCEKLTKLDADLHEYIDKCENKTIIVADVFPFRYFVEEYGLSYCAAFPGCAEGDVAPSPASLKTISEIMKEKSINTVFYVEFSSKITANSLASETGCETKLLRSCHALERERFNAGVTYVDLMYENLNTLKGVLR